MGEISERFEALFRLRSLTLIGHPILGSIHLDFCQNENALMGVYTSVVIGINGIGKSHLLRTIEDLFCCLESLYNEEEYKTPDYYFRLSYSSHWHTIEFANYKNDEEIKKTPRRYGHFLFKKDGNEVNVNRIILPKRVIASSTTITDKFVARSTEMYRYKGLRSESSPSTSGTRTMVRKTVDSLLGSLDAKYGFRQELRALLKNLGLQPRLELSYRMRYKEFFVKSDITKYDIIRIFEKQDDIFERKSKLWGTNALKRIKEKEDWRLDYVAEFLQRLSRRGFEDGRRLLRYDLLSEDSTVSEDREALKALSQLDILSYPSLKVFKSEENYEFDQSSSGESSLLCQLVSIMSDIEPNSLILIDEPEASAHPNWQINYIDWLKKIFLRYYNCHFVISTHSHFILTDLEPATSDIIALEKRNGVIRDVSEGVNTFNWSVDDILYRVFGVRNTRNRAFEEDIMELYKMISEGSKDWDKIKQMTERLSSVVLPGNDPLLEVLNQAHKYVETK